MSYATPSNEPRPIVSQYMTLKVEVVSPDDSVAEVAKKIDSTGHDGFPVCVGRQVVGFVTARDLLLSSDNVSIFQVMSKIYWLHILEWPFKMQLGSSCDLESKNSPL